jgi:hypothetical protein
LGGRTIRAKSAIFALRRKMEPKGIRGGLVGGAGGMIFGVLAREAAGFRMKGESLSSGGGVPVETGGGTGAWGAGEVDGAGAGSAFFASSGSEAAAGGKAGKGGGVHADTDELGEAETTGSAGEVAALDGLGSDLIGAGLAGISTGPFSCAVSGASGFKIRTLPVCLSVCTGSASAINCSIFFRGDGGRAGAGSAGFVPGFGSAPVDVDVESRAGGRRTTPCIAGNVRVAVVVATGEALGSVGAVAACGPSATGTGLIAGG